jgi:hypothetical protein
MKLLIKQFSQTYCCFFPIRTEYSPQQPVQKHPNVRDQVSHAQNNKQNYSIMYMYCNLSVSRQQLGSPRILN